MRSRLFQSAIGKQVFDFRKLLLEQAIVLDYLF